jgi:hypothetical protein
MGRYHTPLNPWATRYVAIHLGICFRTRFPKYLLLGYFPPSQVFDFP